MVFRHDIYKTQYRAMFVMNCCVVDDEVLFVASEKINPSKKRKSKNDDNENSFKSGERHFLVDGQNPLTDCPPEDLFKPVRCSKCNTEVAVYDHEEIYHFFNVLSSYV